MTNLSRRGLLAAGLLWLAGCGGGGGNVTDFTPPADRARAALTAALDHWKAGKPPGTVPGTAPVVEVTDTPWKNGQKLKGYEIVSETPPADGQGPRTFTVRLTLEKGPPVETQYMVLGIDPLLVYRKEDFAKLSGSGM